jgi:hypothetical protein
MARRAPKIGDERFLIEILNTSAVEALARKQGWDGGEGLREFCEPEEAAVYWTRSTLDEAVKAAKDWLSHGTSFYGCAIIDRQVFEAPHDDRGNPVDAPATWERHETYEVAMDGEMIQVAA